MGEPKALNEGRCPCGCGRPVEGRQVFADECYAVALDGPCVGQFIPGYVYRGPLDMSRVSTTFVAFDSIRHEYRWRNGGFRHVALAETPSQCGKKLPPGHGWCYEPYGHGTPHIDCGGHEFSDDGRPRGAVVILKWWRARRERRLVDDMHRVGFALSVMEGTAAMDVMRSTGLSSGRVMPALARLERSGAITSYREPRTGRRLFKQVWP